MCLLRGGTKSRNGEMRNEKLEMRKWKRKWKWSSLLLVDNTDVDAIEVYLWYIKRSVVILFVKIYIDRSLIATIKFNRGACACVSPGFSHMRQQFWIP